MFPNLMAPPAAQAKLCRNHPSENHALSGQRHIFKQFVADFESRGKAVNIPHHADAAGVRQHCLNGAGFRNVLAKRFLAKEILTRFQSLADELDMRIGGGTNVYPDDLWISEDLLNPRSPLNLFLFR